VKTRRASRFGALLSVWAVSFCCLDAASGESHAFVNAWREESDGWGFVFPAGVAVDSSGNVFVADPIKHSIKKFDSSGKFLRKWSCEGFGEEKSWGPRAIAVDSKGNVFVADKDPWDNYRILKFDSSGKFLRKWSWEGLGDRDRSFPPSPRWAPEAIAVDSKRNVFVGDFRNARIQKFDTSGNFLTEWSSQGSSMAVDSKGNLFVADIGNNRIQKFDPSGKFLTKWGSKGSGDGEFDGPRGIAVDSGGNVFVAEYGNHRIQKFDSSGKFLAKWGSEGSRDGELKCPYGIAVDSSGNVYVADTGNRRIQKFDSSGKFLTKWGRRGFILRCWITAALILVVVPLGVRILKIRARSTRKAKPLPEREEDSKAKEPSFWANIPRIFVFPFRGAGPFVMVTGGVVLAGMDWLDRCHQELVLRFHQIPDLLGRSSILALGWIVIVLLVLGYVCKYFLQVTSSSAVGREEPPDFQEIEPAYRLRSLWRFLVPFMLSFGPFIICLIYLGYLLHISVLRQVVAWHILAIGLLIAGSFYFPISLGAVAVLGSVRGAGPVPVIRSIVRSPLKYVVTWLVFTPLASHFLLRLGLRQFGLILIEIPVLGAVVRLLGSLYLKAMHIPFLGDVFAWFLSLYCWIAAMHLLGIFYRSNRDGWDTLLTIRRPSPLINNSGIGEGDGVDLRGNRLSDRSINILIPELEQRGVKVLYDKPE